jgi:ABC-type spermidine/putrescine transport system permease subunit I
MKWLDNSFWVSYYPLIIILIFGYPIYRVLRNKEDNFKTKILYLFLIILLPLIGSIVYLFIEIRKRFIQ